MTEEKWVPVIGFEGLYEVSTEGRVRGLERRSFNDRLPVPAKIIAANKAKVKGKEFGYWVVRLNKDGKRQTKLLHLLVLTAFSGPRPDGMVARHDNGNTDDNRSGNLLWGTPLENNRDRYWHGTMPFGEKNGWSKLTDEDVRFIKSSKISARELGERFGVTASCIYSIRKGKTWSHISAATECQLEAA